MVVARLKSVAYKGVGSNGKIYWTRLQAVST
jgi:hypothetical protein